MSCSLFPSQPTPLISLPRDIYSPYFPAETSWKSTVIPNRALRNRGRIVAERSTRAQCGERRFNSAFWSGVRWSGKHGERVSQVNAKPSVIWLGSKTQSHTNTYGDAGESLECVARIRIRIGSRAPGWSNPPPPLLSLWREPAVTSLTDPEGGQGTGIKFFHTASDRYSYVRFGSKRRLAQRTLHCSSKAYVFDALVGVFVCSSGWRRLLWLLFRLLRMLHRQIHSKK